MLRKLRAHGRRRTKWIVKSPVTAALGLSLCAVPAAIYAQTAPALRADSLKLRGLNYEKELTALYLGDFANSRLEPESGTFASIFPSYVMSFARSCAAYLPKNRVPIMEQVCQTESRPVNIYGNPVGPSRCVAWRSQPTGYYADPALLAISERLQARQGGQMIGQMFDRNADLLSSARQTTDVALLVRNDMNQLFGANRCDSSALRRLQDNMSRFARGIAPLRLASGETLAAVRSRNPRRASARNADYARLIDDLIFENAKGWMMNRYVGGSVGGVVVQERDATGSPSAIRAGYEFSQLGQSRIGHVVLTFEEGLPKCLYFSDAPSTCRVPSPRIANAYERGEY